MDDPFGGLFSYVPGMEPSAPAAPPPEQKKKPGVIPEMHKGPVTPAPAPAQAADPFGGLFDYVPGMEPAPAPAPKPELPKFVGVGQSLKDVAVGIGSAATDVLLDSMARAYRKTGPSDDPNSKLDAFIAEQRQDQMDKQLSEEERSQRTVFGFTRGGVREGLAQFGNSIPSMILGWVGRGAGAVIGGAVTSPTGPGALAGATAGAVAGGALGNIPMYRMKYDTVMDDYLTEARKANPGLTKEQLIALKPDITKTAHEQALNEVVPEMVTGGISMGLASGVAGKVAARVGLPKILMSVIRGQVMDTALEVAGETVTQKLDTRVAAKYGLSDQPEITWGEALRQVWEPTVVMSLASFGLASAGSAVQNRVSYATNKQAALENMAQSGIPEDIRRDFAAAKDWKEWESTWERRGQDVVSHIMGDLKANTPSPADELAAFNQREQEQAKGFVARMQKQVADMRVRLKNEPNPEGQEAIIAQIEDIEKQLDNVIRAYPGAHNPADALKPGQGVDSVADDANKRIIEEAAGVATQTPSTSGANAGQMPGIGDLPAQQQPGTVPAATAPANPDAMPAQKQAMVGDQGPFDILGVPNNPGKITLWDPATGQSFVEDRANVTMVDPPAPGAAAAPAAVLPVNVMGPDGTRHDVAFPDNAAARMYEAAARFEERKLKPASVDPVLDRMAKELGVTKPVLLQQAAAYKAAVDAAMMAAGPGAAVQAPAFGATSNVQQPTSNIQGGANAQQALQTETPVGGQVPIIGKPADEKFQSLETTQIPGSTTQIPAARSGQRFEAVTPQGDVRVSGEWAVMDAGALITSDDKRYDAALQPRDRDTKSSQEQIAKIAAAPDPTRLNDSPTTDLGAPMVDELGQVISGNGRVMGLRKAFASKRGAAYQNFVKQRAAELGVDVSGMKNPVLVRMVRDTAGVPMPQVAELSNRPQILQRTSAEIAAADAKVLADTNIMDLFDPSESGDLMAASNRPFLTEFVRQTGDESLRKSDGTFDREKMEPRIHRAVMMRIIGQTEKGRDLARQAIENAEVLGIRPALMGVMRAGGKLVGTAKVKPQYDLSAELAEGLELLVQFKKEFTEGKTRTLDGWLAQQDMFKAPASLEGTIILQELARRRSIKGVTEFLNEYAERAAKVDTDTGMMFADIQPSTKLELLRGARDATMPTAEEAAADAGGVAREERAEYGTRPDYKGIATKAHEGQTRKDGITPYITHPERVVARLAGDPDAQAVAWLHDVVEDTSETIESLRGRGVPENILDAVDALTKRPGVDYAEYIQRIKSNPLARKVKIADMMDNLSGAPSPEARARYIKGLKTLQAGAPYNAASGKPQVFRSEDKPVYGSAPAESSRDSVWAALKKKMPWFTNAIDGYLATRHPYLQDELIRVAAIEPQKLDLTPEQESNIKKAKELAKVKLDEDVKTHKTAFDAYQAEFTPEIVEGYVRQVEEVALLFGDGAFALARGVPLKSARRGIEKAVEDSTIEGISVDAAIAKIKDIVRSTILVHNESDLAAVAEAVKESFGVTKDRGKHKDRTGDNHTLGYEDRLIQVPLSNGRFAEVQVMTPVMFVAKEFGAGHKYYEMDREVRAAHTAGFMSRNQQDKFRNKLAKLSKEFYQSLAKKPYVLAFERVAREASSEAISSLDMRASSPVWPKGQPDLRETGVGSTLPSDLESRKTSERSSTSNVSLRSKKIAEGEKDSTSEAAGDSSSAFISGIPSTDNVVQRQLEIKQKLAENARNLPKKQRGYFWEYAAHKARIEAGEPAGKPPRPRLSGGVPMTGSLARRIRAQVDALVEESRRAMPERAGVAREESATYGTRQTETPEFKKWFRDSRVVNEQTGEPLRVFHGTLTDFDTFKRPGRPNVPRRTAGRQLLGDREMYFFTNDAEVASNYGGTSVETRYGRKRDYINVWGPDVKPNVMPVYLSLQNPLRMTAEGQGWRAAIDRIKNAHDSGNYDGVILYDVSDWYSPNADQEFDDEGNRRTSTVYIAFKANQIKSATGNRGTFSRTDDSIVRESRATYGTRQNAPPAPPFFSQLRRHIEAKMPNRATVEAVRNLINPEKGSGVKAEEIEWTGLNDFLAGKSPVAMVTKADVLAAIQDVQVEEVTLSQSGDLAAARRAFADSTMDDLQNQVLNIGFLDSGQVEVMSREELLQAIVDSRDPYAPDEESKYHKYQLPGGENYRELLLTLPDNGDVDSVFNVTSPDGNRVRQVKTRAEADAIVESEGGTVKRLSLKTSRQTNYTSSHFDQPNIIAHIRFNERTDAEGRRVVFMEEAQSDWHQKGREKGYRDTKIDDDLRRQAKEIDPWLESTIERWIQAGDRGYKDTMRHMPADVAKEYEAKLTHHNNLTRALSDRSILPPDAPFKNNAWAKLALRRMVRWAAENGFDAVAWTTGEQQAERYDLSKQVDRLLYDPDTKQLFAIKDGKTVIDQSGVTKDKLADYVGKDAAKRMLDSPRKQTGAPGFGDLINAHELTGDGLKVGGEGMKGFYDKIMVNLANEIGKKFGARVGTLKIGVVRDTINDIAEFDTEAEAQTWAESNIPSENDYSVLQAADGKWTVRDNYVGALARFTSPAQVHSLPITPAMRESVMQGQALFERKPAAGYGSGQLSLFTPDVVEKAKARTDAGLFDDAARTGPLFGAVQKKESDAPIFDEKTRQAGAAPGPLFKPDVAERAAAAVDKPLFDEKTMKTPMPDAKSGIGDFGEKIGGARKDMWADRHLEVRDLEKMTDREMMAMVKKDQIFPTPDYVALTERVAKGLARAVENVRAQDGAVQANMAEGMANAVAMIVKDIRDSMPAKADPRWSREKVGLYVEAVGKVRDALAGVERIEDVKGLLEKIFGADILLTNASGYGRSFNRDADGYKYLAVLDNKFLKAVQVSDRDVAKAHLKAAKTGFPGKREAWRSHFQLYKISSAQIHKGSSRGEDGQYRDTWFVDGPFDNRTIARFSSRDAADAWMEQNADKAVLVATSRVGADGLGGKRMEVFDSEDAARAKAASVVKKDADDVAAGRKEPTRPMLESVRRVGDDYRKGRKITEKDFQDTFGFRGGEFGNWLSNEDRQASLNFAYDALMDLANVLGVPPMALSLNGELGLAFGARGKGGNIQGGGSAAAHYEPVKVVVNLTKWRGAGSLAHEWAHAVDDYFGRQSGAMRGDPQRSDSYYVSSMVPENSKLRPEVAAAYKRVMDAILTRPMTAEELRRVGEDDRAHTDSLLAKSQKNARGWLDSLRREMTDAPADVLAKWDALAAQIVDGKVGERIADPRAGRRSYAHSYQILEDLNDLRKQVTGRIHSADGRKGLMGNMDMIRISQKQVAGGPAPAAAAPKTTATDWRRKSIGADEGKKRRYWSARHEMFARGFETYVYDKLAEADKASQYLVAHVGDAEARILWEGLYPSGPERKAVVDAFDALFDVIETKATDAGVMMYSMGDGKSVVPRNARLSSPVYGPTGAAIVGYEWRSEVAEKFDRRDGGYVAAKVSDWDNSAVSTGTGREIVHLYYIQRPDGTVTVEGVNSAKRILGWNSSKRLQAVAKTASEDARRRDEWEKTEIEKVESMGADSPAAANAKFRSVNWSSMRTPAENDAILDHTTVYEKAGRFVVRINSAEIDAFMRDHGWSIYQAKTGVDATKQKGVQDANASEQGSARKTADGANDRAERDGSVSENASRWQGWLEDGRARIRSSGIGDAESPFAGVEVDSAFGETDEFRFAQARASQAGLNLVPITRAPFFEAGILGNTVYVSAGSVHGAEALVQHEIFHAVASTPPAQALMGLVNRESEAFKAYRSRLIGLHAVRFQAAGYDLFRSQSLARQYVTGDLVAEELAADFYAEVGNKFGVAVADAFTSKQTARTAARDVRVGVSLNSRGDANLFRASMPERLTYDHVLNMRARSPAEFREQAFHGTPHVLSPEYGFPHGRFRLDKIGTGEGAQAYGWGIYFAEKSDVAKTYRHNAESRARIQYQPVTMYQGEDVRVLDLDQTMKRAIQAVQEQGHSEALLDAVESKQASLADAIRRVNPDDVSLEWREIVPPGGGGSLYRLDIPDDVIPTLLEYEAKLGDQPKHVRDALARELGLGGDRDSHMTGNDIYNYVAHLTNGRGPLGRFRRNKSDQAASEALASIGIPGLRFRDQQSRPTKSSVGTIQENIASVEKRLAEWQGEASYSEIARIQIERAEKELAHLRKNLEEAKGRPDTRNTVIWDQAVLDRIALLERNEQALDAAMDRDVVLSGSDVGYGDGQSRSSARREYVQGTLFEPRVTYGTPDGSTPQMASLYDYRDRLAAVIRRIDREQADAFRLSDDLRGQLADAVRSRNKDAEATARRRLADHYKRMGEQVAAWQIANAKLHAVATAIESRDFLGLESAEIGMEKKPAPQVTREDVEKYLAARDVTDPAAVDRLTADLQTIREASTAPYQMDLFAGVDLGTEPMTPAQEEKQVMDLNDAIEEAFTNPTNKDAWEAVFSQRPEYASTIIPELIKGDRVGVIVEHAGVVIRSAADYAAVLMPLRSPLAESVKVAFLNKSGQIIESRIVSLGTIDSAVMSPARIFHSIPDGTVGVIMSHNHPSGNPSPSREDIVVTKDLMESARALGVPVIDHVITNGGKYVSLRESGRIDFGVGQDLPTFKTAPADAKGPVKTLDEQAQAEWEIVQRNRLKAISNPGTLDGIVKAMRQADKAHGHAIILNTKYRMTAIARFPVDMDAVDVARMVGRIAHANGGAAVLLDMPENTTGSGVLRKVIGILKGLKALDVEVLDAATLDNQSLRESGLVDFTANEERAVYGRRAREEAPGYGSARSPRVSPEQVARHAELEAKHKAGTITPEETAEAERIVEAAAKAAGYNVGPVWHGTKSNDFHIFDKTKQGTATDYGWFGPGFYFSEKAEVADGYGPRKIRGYLKLGNPWETETVGMSEEYQRQLRAEGYDGIVFRERASDNKAHEIIVFDPSQIKSADPFTGVPLDQRFDPASDSILRETPPGYGSAKPSKTMQEMERELEALRQELKHFAARLPAEVKKANAQASKVIEAKNALIQKLLAHREDVAETQRLLAAYMREAKLPDSEHKRMITAIIRLAKLKTPAALRRHYLAAVEHIDGAAKYFEARESINKVRELLKASFPKIVNMYPRGKLTADAHKELKKIAVITNFDEKRIDKELDRLGDEIDAFSDPDRTSEPARPLADVLHEQFLVMTFGNLNGQNPDQAKKAVESLEKFIELGMFEHQAKEKARQERIAKLRETAVDIISGGKGAMDKVDRLRKNLNRGVARRVVDAIDAYDTGHQSFEWLLDKLSRFEGQSGVLKSELQYWADLAHRATHDEVSGRRDAWGQVQTKLQEIYGLKGYRLAHVLSENSKVVAKTGVMLAGGKEAPMSRNQAYKLWQVFQDPSQYDRLLNPRNGYTADTPAQLEAFMGTKLTEYAKWQLDEFYPKYYEGVNRVYRELYFIDLPFNNRYSPITAEFENAFEDDKLLENPKRQSSVLNGSLKMRKPNANSEIRLVDGDSLLVRHIVQMEHFKHWGLVMRDMRGVFNNPDVSRAVRDYHGDFAARTLKGFVNDFARGGEDQALVLGSLDKMRSYFTRAVVASGVTTLKQLTSIPAAMSDLGPGEFMAGLASFMTNPVGKSREMFAASKMLQNRYEAGFDRDVMLALRRSEPTRLSGAASIGEIFSWFTRGGDIAAVLAAGYTMYRSTMNKAMAAGKSADVAKAEAVVAMEKAVERVQQAGNVKDLGAFQRLGSFAKLFTMFMTAPIAYYRVWSGGWRNLVHGRGSKAENVRRIALTHIVLPMFFQYVADAFMWGNPDDDDEDDRLIPWLPKTQTRALLLGPMNGLFIAGNGLNHIIAAFQKEKTFGDFASVILPPADIGNDITKAARRIGRSIINGEITEKDLRSLLEDIAEAGGKLTGMPTGPAMRMGTGIYEGTTDQTEFPIRRALGYSRFMLGEDPLNDDRGSGAAGTRNNLRPERPTLRGFAERPTLGRQ